MDVRGLIRKLANRVELDLGIEDDVDINAQLRRVVPIIAIITCSVAVVIFSGLAVVSALDGSAGNNSGHGEYAETQVAVYNQSERIDTLVADVPLTEEAMRTGLSERTRLPDGQGMLFVHSEEDTQTYWMKDMSIGIDLVFISSDCTIHSIYSADAPIESESGTEQHHRYYDDAKYVLEVSHGLAESDYSVGDRVAFESIGECRNPN